MKHIQKIVDSILTNNFHGIRQVNGLETIKRVEYSPENRHLLTVILRQGYYGQMDQFEPVKELFLENLAVYRFRDEKSRIYYALFYEAELGLETMALEIFPEVIRP